MTMVHSSYRKITTIIFCTVLLMFPGLSTIYALPGAAGLRISDDTISAELDKTPLIEILETIRREKSIWYKCREILLDEKVSVKFHDVSLENGLNRLLARFNYSLVFDSNQQIIGVLILGKNRSEGSSDHRQVKRKVERKNPLDPARYHLRNFKPVIKPYPPGGPVKEDDTKKIIKPNTTGFSETPPGGPVSVSARELERFKMRNNSVTIRK